VAYNPCGVSSTSQLLYKEFLNNLFRRGERCLGRAVFAAKCSIIARNPDDDELYGPAVLWTLLGDPALRVRHRILTGVEESPQPQTASYELTVSPNPTTGRFQVTIPDGIGAGLRIYDATGTVIRSLDVGSRPGRRLLADVSDLPPGVYFVRLSDGHGTLSAKLMLSRHRNR